MGRPLGTSSFLITSTFLFFLALMYLLWFLWFRKFSSFSVLIWPWMLAPLSHKEQNYANVTVLISLYRVLANCAHTQEMRENKKELWSFEDGWAGQLLSHSSLSHVCRKPRGSHPAARLLLPPFPRQGFLACPCISFLLPLAESLPTSLSFQLLAFSLLPCVVRSGCWFSHPAGEKLWQGCDSLCAEPLMVLSSLLTLSHQLWKGKWPHPTNGSCLCTGIHGVAF